MGQVAREEAPGPRRLRPRRPGRRLRAAAVAAAPRTYERAHPHDPDGEQRRHRRRGRVRRATRPVAIGAHAEGRVPGTAPLPRLGRHRPPGSSPAGLGGG